MTATTSTRRRGVEGNGRGDGEGPFRLDAPKRRVEGSQLVWALLVVGVSALIAVVGFSQVAARQPVLALAVDVARGDVIEAASLRVVHVASDDLVAWVRADAAGGLVGKVAVADLPAGTLAAPGLFVDRAVLESGEGVVGLALAPGEYPTVQLSPGDAVEVVSVEAGVVVAAGEVFDISELGTQGGRFVSLRMPADDATAVAAAAGGVRLVLVAGGGP